MNHTSMKQNRMIMLLVMYISLCPYRLQTMAKVKTPLTVKFLNLLDASMSKTASSGRYVAKQLGASARQAFKVTQEVTQQTTSFWNSKLYKEFIEPIYVGNELGPDYLRHKKHQVEQAIVACKALKKNIQDYLSVHPNAQNTLDYYETALNMLADMYENLSFNPQDPEHAQQMQIILQHIGNALQHLSSIFSHSDFQVFIKNNPATHELFSTFIQEPTDAEQDQSATAKLADTVAKKVVTERSVIAKPLSDNELESMTQQSMQRKQMLTREAQQHGLLDTPLIMER